MLPHFEQYYNSVLTLVINVDQLQTLLFTVLDTCNTKCIGVLL